MIGGVIDNARQGSIREYDRPGLHPSDVQRATAGKARCDPRYEPATTRSLNSSTDTMPSEARLSALSERLDLSLRMAGEITAILGALRGALLCESDPPSCGSEVKTPSGMVNLLHYQVDALENALQTIARNAIALDVLR